MCRNSLECEFFVYVLPVMLSRRAFQWALGCADVCLQVEGYKETHVL